MLWTLPSTHTLTPVLLGSVNIEGAEKTPKIIMTAGMLYMNEF